MTSFTGLKETLVPVNTSQVCHAYTSGVGVDSVCCLLFWGRGDQIPPLSTEMGTSQCSTPCPITQKAQGLGTSSVPPQSV